MGARPFPGLKRLVCGINHPPASSAEVKERAELFIYSSSVFMAGYRVTFTFTLEKLIFGLFVYLAM